MDFNDHFFFFSYSSIKSFKLVKFHIDWSFIVAGGLAETNSHDDDTDEDDGSQDGKEDKLISSDSQEHSFN